MSASRSPSSLLYSLRRIICRMLGHSWRHEWGPSTYAPISCTRCGIRDESGTRRDGGYRKRSAFTRTKEHGTTTPATATTAECSFFSALGKEQVAALPSLGTAKYFLDVWHTDGDTGERMQLVLESSFIVPGSSTRETATRGTNGAPPADVAYDSHAWDRANREALA